MKTKFYALHLSLIMIVVCMKTNAQNANTALSNLKSPTKVNVNLLPDKDHAHNLGSLSKAWKNLYLNSAIYIDSSRFIAFHTGSGEGNTAIGKEVLLLDSNGYSNTATGYRCLYHNKSGYENVAMGRDALYLNNSGYGNVAIGHHSLFSNKNGSSNTAIGESSLYTNTSGPENTANGAYALYSNTTGDNNTANGVFALYNNTSGYFNTANGGEALWFNTTGINNTANGYGALFNNTSGGENTANGFGAGATVTDGSNNTFVGYQANCGSNSHLTNSTAIGNGATVTSNNYVVIGNESVTHIGGYVNWTKYSDGRIKKNIKQNVPGLSFINKLQPVTYNLNLDAADKIIDRPQLKDKDGKIIQLSQTELAARKAQEQIVYTGFIAQDVEKAAQGLHYDFSGVDKPDNANTLYGLRYSDFVVPLVKAVQELNDSLKQSNENLTAKLNAQQKEIEELKAIVQQLANKSDATFSTNNISISTASLLQNIPNPFSNSTTINYSIPQKFSSAKIIITDKNGNALKTITLSNNKGSVNIDAATLSSGAYQYSLYVDGKLIDTKQMEHLK